MLVATSCVIDRAGSDDSRAQYSLTVDRTTQEGLHGKNSTVRERTFGKMIWMHASGESQARFQVDSVRFSRDGHAEDVGPASSPVGVFAYRTGPGGRYMLDSLPDGLREHPYLATVALELPDIRAWVTPEQCRRRTRWTDSASVGPVPIPGVDGAISTYRAAFAIDSIRADTVAMHAVSEVTTIGVSGSDTLLRGLEHRDEHWRFADRCRGPASSLGTTSLTIVYFGVRNGVNDTVTASEERSIGVKPR
jgi:hypothetical protein